MQARATYYLACLIPVGIPGLSKYKYYQCSTRTKALRLAYQMKRNRSEQRKPLYIVRARYNIN